MMSKNIYQKIERDEDSICQTCIHRLVCRAIDNQPCTECNHYQVAAGVAEVRHGRWVKRQNPQWKAYYHDACSICGWWNTKNSMCYNGKKKPGHSLNYCPNCGARMGKEDEHEVS